jgi:hypothetical protein
MQSRLFLMEYISRMEKIINNPSVDNMLSGLSLVSAYKRIVGENTNPYIGLCRRFEEFLSVKFVLAVEGKSRIEREQVVLLKGIAFERLKNISKGERFSD